jgi:uncharacterized protein (TIGR02231 family)
MAKNPLERGGQDGENIGGNHRGKKRGIYMTTLDSQITDVTVFTDRAQVTRTAALKLTRGEHTLVFGSLPESMEQNSVQVNGEGNAVLQDVSFKTEYFSQDPDEATKALYEEKRDLEDEIAQGAATTYHANQEMEFINNITGKLTRESKASKLSELDPDNWIKMVDFYRSKLDGIHNEISQVEKHQRKLNAELGKLENRISDIGGQQKSRNNVEVTVEMQAEEELKLHLSYIVYGPSWHPIYDLRVSTEDKVMSIAYNAMVSQNTSEDWDDVRIKLSTAQPQIGGHEPALSPWRVSMYSPPESSFGAMPSAPPPEPIAHKVGRRSQMFDASNAEMEAGAEDALPAEMAVRETAVETQATSVVFVPAGKNTIKEDGTPHKVSVLMESFSALFRYSTVPKLAPYAYLKAKVTNKTDYPFLAGECNVFLDNNFVATSQLELVAPGEAFWAFLGVDEGIKVEHKFLKKYRKDEGLLSKKTVFIYEYLIRITNKKTTQEELVVWDQVPISENKDIVVTVINPKYEKNTDTLKMNEHKFLEWFFKPKPGEKIELPFSFSVEHPRNMNVTGL